MALDTLEIFGDEFTNVTGIKATDNNNQIKTYIRPQGNLAITANSASTDVTQYATVSINVSNNEVWKPVQAQTRTIVEDPNGNYLWYDGTSPDFAEGQTWRVTWGDETYIVQTTYGTLSGRTGWFLGNPGVVGETDDGSGYTWFAWNYQSGIITIGTTETGSKKVILELQQSNPYQAKTVTYTPSETQQTATVVPDTGYNGLSTVGVTVNAIPSQYIVPSGSLSITSNGTQDVTSYASVEVNVSTGSTINNQNKTVTPSETQQSVSADSGYTGLGTVTVNAVSSTYVGSGITRRSSTDLTVSGATVTAPAGYYSAAASKSVASGSASAPSSISGTSASVTTGANTLTLTKTVSVTPVVSAGYVSSGTATNSSVSLTASIPVNPTVTASGATVTIPTGYYTTQTTKSVASGSATGPTSLSGSSATVSTGTNTLTLTKTGVTTTPTVSAGYVSSATASTATVSLTASVTTKAAATITPTTTNQTIAAGTYLTGAQTIAGDADLIGSNILSTANIFGVQGTVDFIDVYVRSAAPTSSVGNDGDIYIQE